MVYNKFIGNQHYANQMLKLIHANTVTYLKSLEFHEVLKPEVICFRILAT